MGTIVKNYFEGVIEDVERRLPNVRKQIDTMRHAISKEGDWREVEVASRLLFRLNKLSLKKESAMKCKVTGIHSSTILKWQKKSILS